MAQHHIAMMIPAGPEGLTVEWLTQALRSGGATRRAAVVSFDVSPVSDQGLFGQLARLRLKYDLEEEGAPRSLIAKLSSATPEMRQRANTRLAYQREVRFYQRLADQTPLRTPACYYGDVDPETGLHVLLLEDLAPARSGSAAAGCSPTQAEFAVRQIARLHAAWWGRPELEEIDWLIDINPDPALLRDAHDRWWPEFLKRAGQVLPEPLGEIGERLREHLAPILRHLTGTPPRTLIHSDYKLENLLFGEPNEGVPFAVIDWQLMGRGRGVWDVAYFLAQNLHPEARRAVEMDLLRTYHQDLIESGVRGYSFEECLYDFRLSLLRRFGSLISTIAAMPFTEEQIRMHVDVLLPRTCAAILDHMAGDLMA